MTDIKEMILALDKVTPGIASDETLLYGVEVKFLLQQGSVDKDFVNQRTWTESHRRWRFCYQRTAAGFCKRYQRGEKYFEEDVKTAQPESTFPIPAGRPFYIFILLPDNVPHW